MKAQRICIGLCQQRRGYGFCQPFIAEQIQLVPAAIRKTEGRMAEDSCWIKIVEG